MGQNRQLSRKKTSAANAKSDVAWQQLGWYFRNCALSSAAGVLERILLEWLNRIQGEDSTRLFSGFDSDSSFHAKDLNRLRQELRRILPRFSVLPRSDESLELNALFASDEFGLDKIDTEILLLLLRYERNSDLEQFADEVLRRLHDPTRAIASLLGIDCQEVRRRIAGESPLISTGLLSLSDQGHCNDLAGQIGYLQMAPLLRRAMYRSHPSQEDWAAAIVGPPHTTPLEWEDFEHFGSLRDLAAKVLASACQESAKGINLLLYGPVGTGKTEFAKALAVRVGMGIWSVGEADEGGGEPTRGERLAALKLAQRLLSKRRGGIILLDEAEDILAADMPLYGVFGRGSYNGSKVYTNRVIEENSIPVLWTCNDVTGIDPAILRRMTLAIEVKTPSQTVRARIWQRVLAERGLELGEEAVYRLSSRYAAPPAVAANAARVAALSGGGEAAIEETMSSVLQLLGIPLSLPDIDRRDFDPEVTNCEHDLTALANQLARPETSQRWSLCIHGAPGTGKSQFAHYLAARLRMEVLQRRASDLLSMWVGGSEKNIAAAFQEARTQRALLVIDEADSLLADRRDATHTWEVTQVNEMLTWMENHPLPLICTTNLMENLDEASLRRFTLKLRFDPLTSSQAALAFERILGVRAPRRLADGLTPGDFATVRRKRDLFGAVPSSVLADWLDEEAAAKKTPAKVIGFLAARG